jgi:hypothetical protein
LIIFWSFNARNVLTYLDMALSGSQAARKVIQIEMSTSD